MKESIIALLSSGHLNYQTGQQLQKILKMDFLGSRSTNVTYKTSTLVIFHLLTHQIISQYSSSSPAFSSCFYQTDIERYKTKVLHTFCSS